MTLLFPLLILLWQTPAPKAEEPPKPPTEVQQLKLQNALQRLELAHLKVQEAQREFEAARQEAQKTINSLKVPGYSLDLKTMTHKKEEAKK